MRYAVITVSFWAGFVVVSLVMVFIFGNPSWINSFSTLLGLGLLVCFVLNVIGSVSGFKRYSKPETTRKEKVAAWLNLGLVLFFIGALIVPNVIDVYNIFNS